jgi:hypothetical protein
MKKFKTIDYRISILLIAIFTLISLTKRDDTFIIGYFVIGAWQVISMIIHAWNGWFTRAGTARSVYHWIALISVVTLPIGSFMILLFTAPFMALYYTYLCYHEVRIRMQRPLALLK